MSARPLPPDDLVVPVHLPASWLVGGAVFGGAVGAIVAGALVDVLDRPDLVPVSVATRFLRPSPAGPALVRARVDHSGGRTAAVSARLECAGRLCATVQLTLHERGALPVIEDPGAPASTAPGWGGPPACAAGARVDWRADEDWTRADGEPGLSGWWSLRDAGGLELDAALRTVVASDLAGPALARAGESLPFRIASTSLAVEILSFAEGPWLRQRLRTRRLGGPHAIATLELSSPSGRTVALATHRIVVGPATRDELPAAVAAFGWGRAHPSILEDRTV